jgi:hypothetical protein
MIPREINPDDPITLKEACEIVFRNTVGPDTLKAAAAAGNLEVSKIGRTLFTTLRDARELHRKCLVEQRAPASISTRPAKSGSSETEDASSAQASARATVEMLKRISGSTSGGSTSRRQARARS